MLTPRRSLDLAGRMEAFLRVTDEYISWISAGV